MEEHQNVRLSTGPSDLSRSYYTGNSFSASTLCPNRYKIVPDHQFCAVHWSYTQEINDGVRFCRSRVAWPISYHARTHLLTSSSVFHSSMSQVNVMPTSLADAITQLSFHGVLTTLRRLNCSVPSRLSYQSQSHSWMLAVQATPHCDAFQDVSTQTVLSTGLIVIF